MSRAKRLFWTALFGMCLVCALGCLVAWGVLLTAICSPHHARLPDLQHTLPYHCHGMTVFVSRFEEALREWLLPAGGLFVGLSVIAGLMTALSTGKVKIKVEVRVEDTSRGEQHSPLRE